MRDGRMRRVDEAVRAVLSDAISKDLQEATRALGLAIFFVNASTERDIDTAFAGIVQRGVGALLVGNDPYFTGQRDQIVPLAARHALPAFYTNRASAVAGGLASYGTSITEAYREMGRLCWENPQGHKACRFTGRAANQVRTGD